MGKIAKVRSFVADLVRFPHFLQLAAIIALLILVAMCAGCATQPTNGDMTITLKAAKVQECKAQGGCGFISMQELLQMLNEAFELGKGSGI